MEHHPHLNSSTSQRTHLFRPRAGCLEVVPATTQIYATDAGRLLNYILIIRLMEILEDRLIRFIDGRPIVFRSQHLPTSAQGR